MRKNTPQLWNEAWERGSSKERDAFNLMREENSVRWQRIEAIVLREFGSFRDLKVLEIGAGAGTNAALMAKRRATVTVLDYADSALARSRDFFANNGLSAEFIRQDALSLPSDLMNKYDISMSFGLTEHFSGPERILVNKAHFDVLRPGGITFISVPNRLNPPYRLYKFLAELTGLWQSGEEYPYSRREFRDICKELKIEEYAFFGDSLFSSLSFIDPLRIARKLRKREEPIDLSKIKRESGTFVDQYLSYALVLYGKKQVGRELS